MDHASILAALTDTFGEDVTGGPEGLPGDPYVVVTAGRLHEVVEHLKSDPALAMDQLKLITGIDRGDVMECVYHLYSYTHFHAVTLKVKLDRDNPQVQSVVDLHGAAEWHERETFDMTGIRFAGHENLRRILLPEDWVGYPLRADYKEPEEYHGIPNRAS